LVDQNLWDEIGQNDAEKDDDISFSADETFSSLRLLKLRDYNVK
jgi:hypothetical protein